MLTQDKTSAVWSTECGGTELGVGTYLTTDVQAAANYTLASNPRAQKATVLEITIGEPTSSQLKGVGVPNEILWCKTCAECLKLLAEELDFLWNSDDNNGPGGGPSQIMLTEKAFKHGLEVRYRVREEDIV